jgi:tellurite resistance protein TerC
MLAVLVVVETTDIMFAVDSVPAVLAITREPFIVWTSNVAAILGLRALYFLISGVLRQFRYLHYGLAVVLIYVGGKMAASEFYKIPTLISLGVIAVIVGTAIVLSVVAEMRERAHAAQPVNPGPTHGHGKDG